MEKTIWLSTLPSIITIGLAIWSKKILPSLFAGLLVGSYLLQPTLTGGFETAADTIINLLSEKSNLQVLLFLYLFSGLIALLKNSGGISAFSEKVESYVKSERGVFYTLWALIPITFIDCGFRVIGAGSLVRGLAEKNKVSKSRLAFMLNNTASPIVELIPIATTFVGFNVANINQGLKNAAITDQSAFSVLLHAIPFEFFSIVVLVITFISIYYQWKAPKDNANEETKKGEDSKRRMEMPGTMTGQITREKSEITSEEKSEKMSADMPGDNTEPAIKPRILNLVAPMLSVIGLSFFFFWYFASRGLDTSPSLSALIEATDPNRAMLVALLISIAMTSILYFAQKYKVKKMTSDFISGGNEIITTLAILTVAWSLAAVSQELGLTELVKQQAGDSLPSWSIAVSFYALSSAMTYFIGSGWGSASLIMPFAIPLAASSGAGIPLCVAAVITGGTFGDVTSPIAGMTNMTSGVLQTDHAKYLKYASPYNFLAAGIAAVLFLVAGIFF